MMNDGKKNQTIGEIWPAMCQENMALHEQSLER